MIMNRNFKKYHMKTEDSHKLTQKWKKKTFLVLLDVWSVFFYSFLCICSASKYFTMFNCFCGFQGLIDPLMHAN